MDVLNLAPAYICQSILFSSLLLILPLSTHAQINGHPEWSPDGWAIAFESNHEGDMEIYLLQPDGSEPLNLTNNPGMDFHPSWSADGEWIYFDSDRGGNFDSYRIRRDGSECELLVSGPGRDLILRESIAGHVFNSDRDGDFEVYWMAPGELEPHKITDNSGTDIVRDWTSGSDWIVFDSDRDSEPGGRRQLYLHHFADGHQKRLTKDEFDNRFARRGPPGSGLVSFTSDRSGTRGLWLIDPMTGEITLLFDSEDEDSFASWSPAGDEMAFQRKSGDHSQIYILDVASGELELIEPWAGETSTVNSRETQN